MNTQLCILQAVGLLALAASFCSGIPVPSTDPAWAPIPSAQLVNELRGVLKDAIDEDAINLIPAIVRATFHDCAKDTAVPGDGCDGCLDFSRRTNGGLITVFDFFLSIHQNYIGQISLADLIVLGYTVALDMASNCKNQPSIRHSIIYRVGRPDCATSPNEDQRSRLVGSNTAATDVLQFYQSSFGLNAFEAVALLGAHAVGGVHIDSRAVGREPGSPFTTNPVCLNNEYFKRLVDERINWRQICTTTAQDEEPPRSLANQQASCRMIWSSGQTVALNVDMGLMFDLTFVPDTRGLASCQPHYDCNEAVTADIVRLFAMDNAAFMAYFTSANQKMLDNLPNLYIPQALEDSQV